MKRRCAAAGARASGGRGLCAASCCGGSTESPIFSSPPTRVVEVDAEILVAEGGAQRAGNVEIALAAHRIDIGRAAAAVATIDGEDRVAEADVGADPVELLPGLRAVDVDVGAKSQGIDFIAPLLLRGF